ncbi:Triple functional domain protein [Schistosoma japonicum]|nr:Triple functional domain protein [Schistosoma japonicum]
MDYANSSLDPEVLEFYRPNRSKHIRCHSHHHTHQFVHPKRVNNSQPTNQPQLSLAPYKNPNYATPNVHHGNIANFQDSRMHQHRPQLQAHVSHKPNTEHYHYHLNQNAFRSSVSPQNLGSTCGGSINTLTSTSGIGSNSSSLCTSSSSRPSHKSGTSLRAVDLIPLLKKRIALLPGGRSRRGGPLLCFPSNSKADEIPIEDLYILVRYLTYLPDDKVKRLGFVVIIDMRSGTTWHSVKPILKVLEECLGQDVTLTFIIKPDKFLEKHKAQLASGKFSFEIQLVSVEALFREVDPSQLTAEMEGSLPYHHEEWIKIRCCLEEFFLFANDMSDKFGQLYCFLDRKLNPESVDEAKRALEEHRSVRLKIVQAPVPALEAEADRLTSWLRYGITASQSSANASSVNSGSQLSNTTASGGGASFLATSWVSMNPDFQQLVPQVRHTVSQLYEFRTRLQQKWEAGRSRLEQIYQLRLFDEDARGMSNWIDQQRHLFLTEYLDIGQTASHAADLHAEHRQFLAKCSSVREQVARLTGVAGMLADTGHFASQQILKQANQLEHEWKSFTAALEDRSRVLQLSASFHARAESFLANCPHWESAMRQVNGTSVHELNQTLITLQEYWQEAQSAHEEVCTDGRALANHLSSPVPTGSHTSLTAAVDYSQGRKHCTDLVHEIWAWFKQLERVFGERRRRLTARLALLMFKEDVGQVLAWLTEHGEPFLQRQTSVGKSIQRAEQLYSAHMQFEQVAANTLTNAEKLISAADELAAQADDPEEILQDASELQHRISAFTRAVEVRRETLDLGCGFYSHTKEALAWLHNSRETHNPSENLPTSIEGMEDELTSFHRNRAAMEKDVDRALAEGEALISRLKDVEEISHLRTVLSQVSNERTTVSTLLTERQVRLDLCLQLRLFEADVHSALDCLRHSIPSLSNLNQSTDVTATHQSNNNRYFWLADPRQAPDMASIEDVLNSCLSALPTAEEVLNKGSELARAFESVGVNFPAGGPGSSDSGMGDSAETAVERVHRLMTELADVVSSVDVLNERLNGELDWRRLQLQSRQVLHWISQCESILHQTAVIPASLAEAETLYADHEKFQPVLNDAHPQAVQCAARASYFLQQTASTNNEHPRRKDYQSVAETVANRWQKLVYAAEERHKLLISATNWYRTSDQVTSVLWSLEKEYRREEDWCQNEKAINSGDPTSYLTQLLSKHAEQKEAFLKACMLARRTSDLFSKYLHRQPTSTTGRLDVEEKIRLAMTELMAKEKAVLEAWAVRRRRLDDCTYFMNLKRQIEDLLERVHNVQDSIIVNKSTAGFSNSMCLSHLNPSLLQEVYRACASLESMIASSSPLSPGHATQMEVLLQRLRSCDAQFTASDVSYVSSSSASGKAFKDSQKADRQSSELMKCTTATIPSSRVDMQSGTKTLEVEPDRTSVSSTSSSGTGGSTGASLTNESYLVTSPAAASGTTQEQRRLARRRENLLRELIQTERLYVQSLEQCIETYRKGLISPPKMLAAQVPSGLVGQADIIFGNILIIYEFHKQTFEPELAKYTESGDFLPEDVGHCFVVHSDRLAELYVEYCVNNTESTRLIVEHGQSYFQSLQLYFNMVEPLQSYLIKPVQRVTKYQLLLRELRDCCDPAGIGEISEGLEAMLNVPKRANDALHLSMLQNLPEDVPLTSLGDVILQDQFTVWEPKQLIKKSRERRVFLFDHCLILAKEAASQPGEHKSKYIYKSRLLLADCNITEHIEGDQCKFALWTGRIPPIHEYRMVLKAATLELKQNWVRALREVMRERVFSVQSLYQQGQNPNSTNLFDDTETYDTFYILENYQAENDNEISVSAHQVVQLLHRCDEPVLPSTFTTAGNNDNNIVKYDPSSAGDWAFIRVRNTSTSSPTKEGFIPSRLIGAPCGRKSSASSSRQSSSVRRGSTSVRKWLPSGVGSGRRGTVASSNSTSVAGVSGTPGKRGSRVDISQSQVLNTPYPVTTSTIDHPPPSKYGQVANSEQQQQKGSELGGLLLDNVSEESVDVELPPPMNEIQPPLRPNASELLDTKNMKVTENCGDNFLLDDVAKNTNQCRLEHSQIVNNDSNNNNNNFENDVQQENSIKTVHRLATSIAEVAGDSQTQLGDVPQLIGLPGGANLSGIGCLRLHGGLNVATKLVAGSKSSVPRIHSANSPDLSLSTNSSSTTNSSHFHGQDEELLLDILEDGVELHFVTRHLFLYDHALIIADAAMELTTVSDSGSNEIDSMVNSKPKLQCRFRHALPISQISVLEDVGVGGTRPTGDQLLWFCVSERTRYLGSPFESSIAAASSPQSHLCYIVAPKSPDSRVRWLSELTSMILEARRLSQAYLMNNVSVNSGDLSGCSTTNHMKLPGATLYPSGVLFDTGSLELPKPGRYKITNQNTIMMNNSTCYHPTTVDQLSSGICNLTMNPSVMPPCSTSLQQLPNPRIV